MNKTAIKNYAVWARNELIERVTRKAFEYGIERDNIYDRNAEEVNGKLLLKEEREQRQQLIDVINAEGYDKVIEEISYTWFNRFIALRFMEVNNYLPNRVRIFTNEINEFKPQILDEAMNIELEGLSKEEVYNLLQSNNRQELYKQLLIATCNDMENYLPGMFTRIGYKELLFPDNLLNNDSVVARLISDIEEDSFNVQKEGQIEIIGWFYQFYNIEPKAAVFAKPKGQKITKEEISAATQLFTPDWIVRYMVENSVGRFWLEGHSESSLKNNWKYYLDEAEQDQEVEEKLKNIRNEYKEYSPEMIKIIDPCMGSGHILVYAFDVLMEIYRECGYSERDAALSILQNNLYGIDIDERAYQLAYFAVMMKARQYNRRILNFAIDGKKVEPNLVYIKNSKKIEESALNRLGNVKRIANKLIHDFEYAEELGSAIKVNYSLDELNQLENKINQLLIEKDIDNMFDILDVYSLSDNLLPLIKQGKLLSQKYTITITNPPYYPISGTSTKLQEYVKANYPDSKTDLFAVFMEVCKSMLKKNGFEAMINMHSWMFLSSYEKLREKVLLNTTIINMAHLGTRAFEEIGGEVVQTTAFVLRNATERGYISSFKRLIDFNSQDAKENAFLTVGNLYQTKIDNFSKIPGSPIAYWVNKKFINQFDLPSFLSEFSFKRGIATGNNPLFIRFWYEVCDRNISFFDKKDVKWFPYNKGGEFRKWYGNRNYVVNWENDGYAIKNYYNNRKLASRPQNVEFNFIPNISYSSITSGKLSFREYTGFINDQAGNYFVTINNYNKNIALGLLNSCVTQYCISLKNDTLNTTADDFRSIPLTTFENSNFIDKIVTNNINLCCNDWNAFETSWDFTVHPLVKNKVNTISEAYSLWDSECNDRFNQLKTNEEELNRIFIDIYGLQDELDPYVEDKDVTVRKADLVRDIKSLISYAVGCMFGRYSLDVEGLVYAGGEWDSSKYTSFIPDKDNIIPICDDEYFDDDIVGRFVKFVETVYGKDTLEENLSFIANALGGKGTSREVIRNYFLNEFYKDHCKIYQKRPIYWLFDSGKKNGFKALIYLHRYQPDLIARLRTQYVFEQQSRYKNQIEMIENQMNGDVSSSEKVRLNKNSKSLKEQDDELRKYEEVVHHYADFNLEKLKIDLDDGVKVNYDKFKDLLAKIK